jgi:hypothetical protein
MKKIYKKKVHKMKSNINALFRSCGLQVIGFLETRMFGNIGGKGYLVKSAQMEVGMVAERDIMPQMVLIRIEPRIYGAKGLPIIDAVQILLYEEAKSIAKLFDKLD